MLFFIELNFKLIVTNENSVPTSGQFYVLLINPHCKVNRGKWQLCFDNYGKPQLIKLQKKFAFWN